jgi:hypothetical protein
MKVFLYVSPTAITCSDILLRAERTGWRAEALYPYPLP